MSTPTGADADVDGRESRGASTGVAEGVRGQRSADAAAAASMADGTGARGRRPPRADEAPVVGKLLQLMRDPDGYYEDVGYGYDADAVAYSVNRTEAVMLTHPSYVQSVLVEEAAAFRKGEVLSRAFDGLAPNGLVASEGEEWARDRALVQPAFYRERVESYADEMVGAATRTADAWADAHVVRVDEDAKDLTLEIIARTMFGTDLSGDGEVIGEAADAILSRTSPMNLSSYLPVWVPTPSNRRFVRVMRDLRETMTALVAERRASDGDVGDDLLSILADAEYADGTSMDRERLQDHLVTFVFAGHETTALLLTWTLWELALNPDVQSKLHAELDDVLDGGTPTADAVRDVEYLRAVVDESTRLHPPAYNVFREAKRDVTVGPWEISEGTTVTTPQLVVHRDERWYDDPLSFDPDRWTAAMRDALPEYAHYPFGGGPRSCIGNRFATLEANLILATILSRFEVDAVTDEVGYSFSATLQPDRPVKLRFRERSNREH
ncbi:cytochrome P450 [Halorubellus sp. PRR65]|uniref:cytochrome P450 n=1 Tax=Halorubellus sp. PRR65 TaxID=3098148 RepID=UPI002B26371C|nr:cytochrome P450 [Halorubellus sp. PRR65]